jgi:hypothetical protein
VNAVETTGDVAIVLESIEALDIDAICALPLDQALICVALLQQSNQTLVQVRTLLESRVAELMPEQQVTVDRAGTFVVHRKSNRTAWDKDDLRRAVLDSRIVNERTGEVRDETPLDKVLHVWNLGAPRTTALRERGLDPDEYCTVERGGLTIEVIS